MSLTTKDIQNLEELSRISLSEGEREVLKNEMTSILDYVAEINKVAVSSSETPEIEEGVRHNIFRDDVDFNEPSANTEKLLALAPEREGNYLKVKKIL